MDLLASTSKAESVTRLLGDDHRRLDALLADAKRALAADDRPRAAARFGEFRAGLESHIAAEERVLFPRFEALTGIASGGPTHVMRVEHAQIRELLAEISAGLGDGASPTPLSTPLAHLTALLLAHNGKEERVLYPASDRAARAAGEMEGLLEKLRLSA